MWEIIAGNDFKTNALAGAIFFVLELILVVGLLPIFLQRRLDKRWLPTRQAFVREVSGTLRGFMYAAQDTWRRDPPPPDNKYPGVQRWRESLTYLQERIQTFSVSFTPEIAGAVAELLDEARNGYMLLAECDLAASRGDVEGHAAKMKENYKLLCDVAQGMERSVRINDADWRQELEREFGYHVDKLLRNKKETREYKEKARSGRLKQAEAD